MCNYLSIVTVGTVNSASGDIVTLSTLLACSCFRMDTFDRTLSGLSVVSDTLFDIIILLFSKHGTLSTGALTHTQEVSCLCTTH